ncbi:MAG: hypothetical protein KGY75_01060 [Candidatus Cloacimonetes bacterium]|nr:hypothetical protein [Candidatus Cloacimonadota bacterium]MBS3766701.1 hypothetical protein [Candidatus Cloacimonadota bacterium]
MFSTISKSIATLAVAIGALLQTNLSPVFNEVQIDYTYDKLICSAKLKECFNSDLDKILISGEKIRIDYLIQILDKEKEVVAEKKFFHEMSYDLIDKKFVLFLSEKEKYEIFLQLEEVKNRFTTLQSIIISKDLQDIESDNFFVILIAKLTPIYMDSIGKEFDLLKYWNNKPAKFLSNRLELKEITR